MRIQILGTGLGDPLAFVPQVSFETTVFDITFVPYDIPLIRSQRPSLHMKPRSFYSATVTKYEALKCAFAWPLQVLARVPPADQHKYAAFRTWANAAVSESLLGPLYGSDSDDNDWSW